MLVDRSAGGAKRKALARRKSAAALDRHRTLGSREEVPTYQRLSRNLVAEGTPESVAHSAEGGPGNRSRLNSVAGSLTVPNIESRCNQLKLGHPRQPRISGSDSVESRANGRKFRDRSRSVQPNMDPTGRLATGQRAFRSTRSDVLPRRASRNPSGPSVVMTIRSA